VAVLDYDAASTDKELGRRACVYGLIMMNFAGDVV
jgi:hypothetical protein